MNWKIEQLEAEIKRVRDQIKQVLPYGFITAHTAPVVAELVEMLDIEIELLDEQIAMLEGNDWDRLDAIRRDEELESMWLDNNR